MSIDKHEMYVCTNAESNNNKFWEVYLHSNGIVETKNGRVGSSGVLNNLGVGGIHLYDQKVREKLKKGYRLVPILDGVTTSNVDKSTLEMTAKKQIANQCPVLSKLVEKLVLANCHELMQASGGQISIDKATGQVRTAVGFVTTSNIKEARILLDRIEKFIDAPYLFNDSTLSHLINEYLMLVPQKVGSQRGWHLDFIKDEKDLIKQNNLLDKIESSINTVLSSTNNENDDLPKVFDVKVKLINETNVIEYLKKIYFSSINKCHTSSKLKPSQFYEIDIPDMKKEWIGDGEKVGNTKLLWHGSRTHNVLSILKRGLIIPKSSDSIKITGRMFGDGLYFSDQATKALNYSHGYWDGRSTDNNCFMFLADVAMGKSYTPRGRGEKMPKQYDSVFAQANKSGVHNNEMIVYRTSQANIRYMIEFSN